MNSSTEFKCPYCPKSLSVATHYVNHLLIKHGHLKNNYPCPYNGCVRNFSAASAIKNHIYRCHREVTNGIGHKFFICSCKSYVNYARGDFIKHISHDITLFGNVLCPIKHCNRNYINPKSFRTHMSRHHRNWEDCVLKEQYEFSDMDRPQESLDTIIPSIGVEKSDMSLVSENFGENEDTDYNVFLSRFALKMEVKLKMSQSAINEVLNDISNLLCINSSIKLNNLKSMLADAVNDLDINEVVSICNETKTSIESALSDGLLSTSHKRKSYISRSTNFFKVEPIEYSAGIRGSIQRFYTYIPILEVLVQLLNNDNILSDILQIAEPRQNVFKNFSDGKFCQGNELFSSSELTLKIHLYIDEVEICNPIGSYKGVHKMTCIYWTLLNISSIHRSQLQAIQPCILIKYLDMKNFSVEETVRPLLRDLGTLETNGVYIRKIDTYLKGSLAIISGDNLSSNDLGGFSTAFSSKNAKTCRKCLVQNKDIKIDIDYTKRTKDNYTYHIEQIKDDPNNKTIYGITKDCPFNALKYFHVVEGTPPDAMHDLLEGIVPFEIALLFKHIIFKKYINYDSLNTRIQNFNYKGIDKLSKMSKIPSTFISKRTVGGNAAQTRTLLRLLPFMIGDIIPVDGSCEHWTLLMLLKGIVELSLTPELTLDMISYLKYQIDMHFSLFKDLFPDQNPKVKHHYVSHYAEAILDYGPLVNLWCMRFEAKHQYVKDVMKKAGNFKNPMKTIAEKHCRLMTYHLSGNDFFSPKIWLSNSKTLHRSCIDSDICMHLDQISLCEKESYMQCKKILFNGMTYSEGQILSFLQPFPITFAEVKSIWFLADDIHFWCQLNQSQFNMHFHLYELTQTEEFFMYSTNDLKDYYPLNQYEVHNSKQRAISLHHSLGFVNLET